MATVHSLLLQQVDRIDRQGPFLPFRQKLGAKDWDQSGASCDDYKSPENRKSAPPQR